MIKRFLINTYTNWCGEENTYAAYAEDEMDIDGLAQNLAYTNFVDFGGDQTILEESFGDYENVSDMGGETENLYNEECDSSYGYVIEEFDGTDEEFGWYELVYDGRNKE